MAQKIKADFILPFIEATHEMFRLMLQQNLKRKEVYIKKNHVMFGDISGIVGLSGNTCGTSSISLPESLAIKCVGLMMDEETSEGLPDSVVHDGVGEMINMVSGQARTSLASTPDAIECTLPTIISGRGHELFHREGTCNVSIIFETEEGEEFAIDVCTDEGKT